MQVADESAKGNVIGDGLNREGGFFGVWNVVEHFQNTRYAEDEHEEDGCPACAEGVTPACLCSWDRWGMQVVEERRTHGGKDEG